MNGTPGPSSARSPGPWNCTIRRFAATYAATEPCSSAWSGHRHVTTAICRATSTSTPGGCSSARRSATAGGRSCGASSYRPASGQAFAARAVRAIAYGRPAASSIAASRWHAVVFPAVPVMPTTGTAERRSTSSARHVTPGPAAARRQHVRRMLGRPLVDDEHRAPPRRRDEVVRQLRAEQRRDPLRLVQAGVDDDHALTASASRIAAMCAGVEPQQPPITVDAELACAAGRAGHHLGRAVVRERVADELRQPRVGLRHQVARRPGRASAIWPT